MPESRQSASLAETVSLEGTTRLRMSPAARRRALRLGIDAHDIVGTGPRGRILLRDLDGVTVADGRVAAIGQQFARRPAVNTVMARPARPPLAQVNVSAAARLDTLLARRQALKAHSGRAPSFASLFIKALGLALRRVPAANVVLDGDRIVRQDSCHVAYMVADAYGQVAFPVVENADARSAADIVAALETAVEEHRARLGRSLSEAGPADVETQRTATSAIANLGPGRVTGFDTNVSRPHATVLAIPAPERVVAPVEGAIDRFRCETRLAFTLGCDSRLVSGLIAAQLLEAFIALIESPDALFD